MIDTSTLFLYPQILKVRERTPVDEEMEAGTLPIRFLAPEYMGAAEYEWGSVPASLNRLWAARSGEDGGLLEGVLPVRGHYPNSRWMGAQDPLDGELHWMCARRAFRPAWDAPDQVDLTEEDVGGLLSAFLMGKIRCKEDPRVHDVFNGRGGFAGWVWVPGYWGPGDKQPARGVTLAAFTGSKAYRMFQEFLDTRRGT